MGRKNQFVKARGTPPPLVISSNTIVYCKKWEQCLIFYRDLLGFPVHFMNDWFVELEVAGGFFLSLADEKRASIKAAAGRGLTLSFRVEDIDLLRESLVPVLRGIDAVRDHPWGGRYFLVRDPDGNRIEFWS